MKKFPSLLAAALSVIAVSCSIKEDRSLCPCCLELTVSGGDDGLCLASVSGRNFSVRDSIDVQGTWYCSVPRGEYGIYAVSGIHNVVAEDGTVRCRDGMEMDEIYSGRTSVTAEGEVLSVPMRLHRQSAFIHISVTDSSAGDYPYCLRLKGRFCGFDIIEGRPVPGDFSVRLHPVVGLYHRVCVPRQGDDSLELEFYDARDGHYVGSEPVGRYIKSSGYDWYAEDLKDIRMDIDYVNSDFEVTISGWDSVRLPEYSCQDP